MAPIKRNHNENESPQSNQLPALEIGEFVGCKNTSEIGRVMASRLTRQQKTEYLVNFKGVKFWLRRKDLYKIDSPPKIGKSMAPPPKTDSTPEKTH